MTTEIVPRPHFAVIDLEAPLEPDPDELTPEDSAWLARGIEQQICIDPECYQKVLTGLGEVATAANAKRLMEASLSPEDIEAAFHIFVYFAGRCDQKVEFDDSTEAALLKAPEYLEAQEARRTKAKPKTITVSAMSHKVIASTEAEPARDALRRVRLAFYIKRMLEWQAQSKSDAH